MTSRLRLLIPLVLALTAVAASTAGAATTRTPQTPEQIRSYVRAGTYAKDIGKAYAAATAYLTAQLKLKPAIRKPAVVLDIDETTLSNYACLDTVGFELVGLATCVVTSKSVAIPAARAFVKLAQRRKVAVFFVTGGPQSLCAGRAANLRAQGVGGTFRVTCRPPTDTADSVVPYKSGARRAIQRQGYKIVANIGDQRSDLSGGAAKRTFKLPNPIYTSA